MVDTDLLLTIHLSFRLLAMALVLLVVVQLLLFERHRSGLLLALTLFCICCYLLMPMAWNLGFPLAPLDVFASSIPALLWLLGWHFFMDERRIPAWFWVLWPAYLLLWIPGFRDTHTLGQVGDLLFDLAPQLVKLGLVVHVIYLALRDRDIDLDRQRLQLRGPVALLLAVVTSIVILVELWAGGDVPRGLEVASSPLLFVVALAACTYLFRIRGELAVVLVPARRVVNEPEDAPDARWIEDRVREDRFYANHGATIGDLAEQLDLPEYRLRGLINQGLGYRNFNQFLNRFRIEEAARRLREESGTPILTIALDVGFKSLSSFNKSFKDTHDCTPSAWRRTD